MFKTSLLLGVCFVMIVASNCSGFSILFHHKTTTEQPKGTTTSSVAGNDRLPDAYFKVNNVPKVEEGCKIRYVCKKKLKHAEIPKPCIKYCVKSIECENGIKTIGQPGQCVELNEEIVSQEYNDCKKDEGSSTINIMQVAMIDFPCQPGYLPDSRGRCREVW